ncbi:MAG: hypothetical protein BAJATHORv1_60161 [Candidatus Thorarchaeota archaeon]|nr:MAG: hypothetical protein BAJATHORv1_60161 [Candidatus Thorarchaeota archaeon]
MLRSIFIFNEGGVSLYDKAYVGTHPDPTLVSGFLTAISGFSLEVIGKRITYVKIDTIHIHIFHMSPIQVMAITDKDKDISRNLLREIALLFIGRFSDKILKAGHSSETFQSFNDILEEIFGATQTKMKELPIIESLDGISILSLPRDLQNVAKYISLKGHVTPRGVGAHLNISIETAREKLEQLAKMKKVYTRNEGAETIYTI